MSGSGTSVGLECSTGWDQCAAREGFVVGFVFMVNWVFNLAGSLFYIAFFLL